MSSITLTNVTKYFDRVVAAQDVNIHVEEGEFITILGPSGSGKTTVLSLIAGLLSLTAGQVHIGGRDVTWVPSANRQVGLVFQNYALFPNMNVFDNIAFPLTVRGFDKATMKRKVAGALNLVRLSGFESRRPHQLSGGQQQRVALARAFVFEPEIMLLDEPLAALDRKLREEVQVELRQLQRSLGITTILVTHDQEEALSLSDRIVVLDDGLVQQDGTPQDVYLRPRNRFVAGFLGTANFLEGSVKRCDDTWVIEQDGGQAVPCGEPHVPAGSKVCAIVRPERVQLAPPDTPKGLVVEVQEAIYLGQSVRYHLDGGNGVEFVATTADRGIRFGPGASAKIAWDPQDTWIIPE